VSCGKKWNDAQTQSACRHQYTAAKTETRLRGQDRRPDQSATATGGVMRRSTRSAGDSPVLACERAGLAARQSHRTAPTLRCGARIVGPDGAFFCFRQAESADELNASEAHGTPNWCERGAQGLAEKPKWQVASTGCRRSRRTGACRSHRQLTSPALARLSRRDHRFVPRPSTHSWQLIASTSTSARPAKRASFGSTLC